MDKPKDTMPKSSDPTVTAAETDDFATMLADYDAPKTRRARLQEGDRVSGKVFHISPENVFISLSANQEGVISKEELTDSDGKQTVVVGDTVEAFVASLSNGILLTRRLSRDLGQGAMLEQALHSGIPVEGTVTGINKGGLEVTLGNTRAFCPIGQVGLGFVEDLQPFLGQTLTFLVKEVRERGRNVVLSRRALLAADRDAKVAQLKSQLAVGQRRQGVVTRIAPFGAFVDLGGIDGLIPLSEMAHQHVTHAEEVMAVGESVEVDILRIEDDPKKAGQLRIALSRKAALADPWTSHPETLKPGATLPGHVTRLEPFGAFVDLYDGIIGLVHISELSTKRIRHPQDVVKLGQEVTVRVLSVDIATRRIALSLREEGEAQPTHATQQTSDRHDERAAVREYNATQNAKGLGTLGDLFKKRRGK